MDIENSIALCTGCDADQRALVDAMPLLSVHTVAAFVAVGTVYEEHVVLAEHIISGRYTYYGGKD